MAHKPVNGFRKAKRERHRLAKLPRMDSHEEAWRHFHEARGDDLAYYGPERSAFMDDAAEYREFERQRTENAGMGDGNFTLSVMLDGREFVMECNFGD